jgi:transposase
MEGKVTLNEKEQRRIIVLNEVEKGVITGIQAAELMDLSLRHFRRLLSRYRDEGVRALAHGNRGRKPLNTIGEKARQQVLKLASTRYSGFNHQHFTEKLAECEGILISRSSVRNILLESGITSPRKRRPPKHRSRRERYPQEGMLLQIDGSPHDWLEGRGPHLTLIGAIDDATGKVPCAFFQEQEDSRGYFLLLREIVFNHGIPVALYHDRHSIFELASDKLPSIEEQLEGKVPITQFSRLMEELGITSISALSPQAKGRIERLWGTFQDRLVSELRLAGARTIGEGNRVLGYFLSAYNRKFATPASQPGSAYRQVGEKSLLNQTFCFKHQRTVGSDNVVRFEGHRLQIVPTNGRASYARCRVEVHERLDGSLVVYYQGGRLTTMPAPPEPSVLRAKAADPVVARVTSPTGFYHKPAPDHPWRRSFRMYFNRRVTNSLNI